MAIDKIPYIMRDELGEICETYLEYDNARKMHVNIDTTRFLSFMEMVEATLTFAPDEDIADLVKMDENNLTDPLIFLGIWVRTNFGLWLEENPHTDSYVDASDPKYPERLSLNVVRGALRMIRVLQSTASQKIVHKSKPLEIV